MSDTVIKTEEKQKNGKHKLSGPGPGRPKGSLNRTTKLKYAFLDAVDIAAKTAGVSSSAEYIAEVLKDNKDRAKVLGIAASLIPKKSKVDMTSRTADSFDQKLAAMSTEELRRLVHASGGAK